MNLPFELQEDKGLREDGLLQPHKIVSLWKMLEFYAAVYMKVCSDLCFLQEFAQKWLDTGDPSNKKLAFSKEDTEKYRAIPGLLGQTGLPIAQRSSELLSKYLTGEMEVTAHELCSSCEQLRWAVINELDTKLVLMIEQSHAGFYRKEGTIFGQDIIDQIPEIEDDASEAGQCFAFERYTACVFHLMRIMECGVHRFAKSVQITDDLSEETWGQVLNNRILPKIEKWPKGPKKDKYRACYKTMDGIRPRRDSIIHHGDHYSEERARNVIGAVKSSIEQYLSLPGPD